MPEFIIEIQDPGTVLPLSETDIFLLTDSVRKIIARGGNVWLDDIAPEMTDFFLALQLPLDGVKTDLSILNGISGDGQALSSLVKACRQLASLVLADGIETAGMQQARDAGAQAGQGYLWPGKIFLYPH